MARKRGGSLSIECDSGSDQAGIASYIKRASKFVLTSSTKITLIRKTQKNKAGAGTKRGNKTRTGNKNTR